ncbi:MAG TPA: phosphoribosyltransferase family protein [Allosphingosinicella sp.]|jgi:hypoxanthine phosphoribosyltransferase
MQNKGAAPELAYIPYEDFLADVAAVAQSIAADPWRPDFIVGIGRGGLVPAAYLSHRLDLPMLSVDVSSGEPGFAAELLVKLAAKMQAGRRILIVDDINDSGGTIISLREALSAHAGESGEMLRVAVLLNNVRSRATIEHCSRTIDRAEDKRWFVFPWEAQAEPHRLIGEAGAVPERLA